MEIKRNPKNVTEMLFIIPARSGSKGVQGKNYRSILGKPLVWWTLEAAYRSSCESVIALTTNCPNVKDVAKDFNREFNDAVFIIDRPEDLCGDRSPTEDAMKHAYSVSQNYYDSFFQNVCLLQPTSPARRENLIDKCFNMLKSYEGDSVFTVSEHTPFFYQRWGGGVRPLRALAPRKMRQDLSTYEMLYHDNGNVYITSNGVLGTNGRIGKRPLLCPTHSFESMQIDTEDDFVLMEMAAKHYGGFL